jgi:hypothetical protein
MKRLVYFMALLLALAASQQGADTIGTITMEEEKGIVLTVNNTGETVNYTFNFRATNSVPAGGLLKITFPEQFPTGLGLTTPTCSLGTCTVSGRVLTVTLTSDLVVTTYNTLVIYSVPTPSSSSGGTGPFIM